MKTYVKVGGEKPFTVGESLPKDADAQIIAIHLLSNLLYAFLERNVFLGDSNQANNIIRKMFEKKNGACLQKNILHFSFPQEICEQFLLESTYSIHLTAEDVSKFYSRKITPQCKLRCNISIDASGKEEQVAIRSIQKTILDSKEYLDSVLIKRYNGEYITTVRSRMLSIKKRVLKPQKKLMDAVYDLQDLLLKKTTLL